MATLQEVSRKEWRTAAASGVPTYTELQIGALQRIADATEKMAQDYDALLHQRNYYKGEVERLRGIRTTLERSNAALRGHLKRAKSKSVEVKP